MKKKSKKQVLKEVAMGTALADMCVSTLIFCEKAGMDAKHTGALMFNLGIQGETMPVIYQLIPMTGTLLMALRSREKKALEELMECASSSIQKLPKGLRLLSWDAVFHILHEMKRVAEERSDDFKRRFILQTEVRNGIRIKAIWIDGEEWEFKKKECCKKKGKPCQCTCSK